MDGLLVALFQEDSILPTVVFVSEACLLDPRSGAAHSARAMLKVLAAAGFTCHAITLNMCDGAQDYPLVEIDHRLDPAQAEGEWINIQDDGLSHHILVTHSTRHESLRPWNLRDYLAGGEDLLKQLSPDLVLTYSSDLLRPLLVQAQRMGARTVFYLANASYAALEGFSFKFIDEIITPSQILADFYRDKMNIAAVVVGDLVDCHFDGRQNLDPARIASRKSRYVTMINPDPAKGGLLFINLAAQGVSQMPDVKFRAVESRWGKAEWTARGADLSLLGNTEWHPGTRDMAKIYGEAALLLVPSLWFEPSARVIAEALLAGVPVLAMRRGGIPEQLNEGGFLFDLPQTMADNFFATPPAETLGKWGHFIKVLMEDDRLYADAVKLALQAAERHQPAVRAAHVVRVFQDFLAKGPLAHIGANDQLRERLAAQRERYRKALDHANASVEGEFTSIEAAQDRRDDYYAAVVSLSLSQPVMREALEAVKSNEIEKARLILEQYLRIMPEDITAIGLLAGLAEQEGLDHEARRLMERVVELAPGFVPGQQQLLGYLRNSRDAEAALLNSFALLERAPNQPRYLALHAGLLVSANRFHEAIQVYEACFARYEGSVQDWMQYALALKTIGFQEKAIAAYRTAIARAPGHGRAWHALANMKLAVFSDEDIAQMRQQLAHHDLSDEDRYNIHFALGKGLEDQKFYAASFESYAAANSIRHGQSKFDITQLEDYVTQAKEHYSAAFFDARKGYGAASDAPVFIVGLHRSGSTLIEQILASHSQIEGTRELPNMMRIARNFGVLNARHDTMRFNAGLLQSLASVEAQGLGQRYLESTLAERKSDRPYFIDKMPGNWLYTGFIHLLLPKAKIIDVRRKPMAAGFALFKMNFGRGVDHSYDQENIARYYRAYADLMAHFDEVLPGRVHHVQYEALVENTEAEVRRLIDYCGLPFEDQCLRYWETKRAIQTPSSEQVRQPIFTGAVDHWQNYAEWLEPMRVAFGDLVGKPE